MILRNKRIGLKAEEVQIQVGFGLPDVKRFILMYTDILSKYGNMLRDPVHEQDLRYFFEHHGEIFLSWPEKWREQLSAWAWCCAVRHGFLRQSATNENTFYFTDKAVKKRGRPKLKD